jgi:hypothetical protein
MGRLRKLINSPPDHLADNVATSKSSIVLTSYTEQGVLLRVLEVKILVIWGR